MRMAFDFRTEFGSGSFLFDQHVIQFSPACNETHVPGMIRDKDLQFGRG